MEGIIKHPLATEKALMLIESQNALVFIVDKKASKPDIKGAIEKMFKVKVAKVNTMISSKGKKKAYVTFSPENPAVDVATELGLM